MRRLLAAAALIGLSLTALRPIEAKAAILKCGHQVIRVNSSMERFWLTHIFQEIEGHAKFTPEQINFEYVTAMGIAKDRFVDTKHVWSANRKSLRYVYAIFARVVHPNRVDDWKTYRHTDHEPHPRDIGQCSIV